ncbi:MAG: leucine-rich repeat domain-containing protein [Chitinispirillaceae bacterium]|nr:leucine-rich repeat domain-containing protein [Chitinispirillaceae bacterium]
MKKAALFFIVMAVFPLTAQDSDYHNDIIDVQNILDRCGMQGTAAQDIYVMENGRVVSLDLKNRDISKDGISFLPPEIGKLTALRVLNCSGNIIDSIPSEIGSLGNLQKLDMSSNRIVVVSPAIGNLSSLTHLDLRHNRIASLPPEIEQCKKLAVLQLWGNKLISLDDAVTRLPALEELYLNDNRLTSLPADIVKLKLRYIDFSGNRLCTLDATISAWAMKKDPHFNETQKCW